MTDELTPEEREALKSLARERIPSAGLEDRVVGAMRDRGFLAKRPGRVVRITNSRVAGLLAACIVLVIGAYSIGLHRGNRNEVIERITPAQDRRLASTSSEAGKVEVPPATDMKPSVPTSEAAPEAEVAPATDMKPSVPASEVAPKKDNRPAELEEVVPGRETPEPKLDWDLKKKESPLPGLVYQEGAARDEPMNATAPGKSGAASPAEEPAASSPAPTSRSEQQSSPPGPATFAREKRPMIMMGRATPSERSSLTFTIDGTTFTVEAPDSVRVMQEEHGRTLLIYTSDGLIRIHVKD